MSQLGDPLYGTVANTRLGHAVGVSSDGLAVATCGFEDGTAISNVVGVVDWSNDAWVPRGAITLPDAANGSSGLDVLSMAFSADSAVVAVMAFDGLTFPFNRSYAYVYHWDGTSWVSRPIPFSVLGTPGCKMGISSDGTVIVFGAEDNSFANDQSDYVGELLLYQWDSEAGQYGLSQIIVGTEPNGHVGRVVSMSASGSVVASMVAGTPSLIVCWILNGSSVDYTETIDGATASEAAIQLSASGYTIAIGSSDNGSDGTTKVFIFGEGPQQRGQTLTGSAENCTLFGSSVALSGDQQTLLVTSRNGDSSNGQVHVYLFDDVSDLWNLHALLADGNASFGQTLALSADGAVAVVGEPFASSFSVSNGGAVRAYNVHPNTGVDKTITWGPVGNAISGSYSGHYLGTYLNLSEAGDTFMAAGSIFNLLHDIYVIERADGEWLSRIPLVVDDNPSVEFRVLDVQMASSGLVVVALVNVVVQDVVEATSVIRFQWDQSGWLVSGEPQTLVESYNEPNMLRVSGNGARLAISEFLAVEGRGRIRVYDWTGAQWVQIGDTFVGEPPITAWPGEDIRNVDLLGITMMLAHDGTRLAFSQVASHQVSVYNLDDGDWVVASVLPQRDHEGTTFFMFCVDMSSSRLVVAELGIQMVQDEDALSGSLRLYALVNDTWTLQRVFLTNSTFAQMPWSSTVAISQDGNVIVIGTTNSDNLQTVRTLIWQPQARAPAWNEYIVTENGNVDSMALSADGTTVALGNSVANDNTGAVTVYRRDGGSAIPCFHGDTIIALADGTVVRVADMVAGMVVRDIHGRAQAVRRVIRRQQADCVYFQPDALAPGVPDRTLLVTPNHLLRHPDGRVMPAGALVAALEEMQRRRAVRVRAGGARVMHRTAARCGRILRPLTVYHIAVDRWSLVRVHNLWAETMVQTVADDRRRQRCVRR
jgi:hypothetical protein